MPYQLYVNKQWRDGAAGKTVDVINPATGETVATSAYGLWLGRLRIGARHLHRAATFPKP